MIQTRDIAGNSGDPVGRLLGAHAPFQSVALVVKGAPGTDAQALALRLVEHGASRIVIYAAGTVLRWTSPFPPGEGLRPFLLSEADLRRVGLDAMANAVQNLRASGAEIAVHLSSSSRAKDLADVVSAEGLELVVATLPLRGAWMRNVHRSRQRGATVLEWARGPEPIVHRPLQEGEAVPIGEGVQPGVILAILFTFLLARFRNG